MGAQGFLRRLSRRLTEDPEERDCEELSDEVISTGAQRVIDCHRGQEVTMVGTLRSVETTGKGGSDGHEGNGKAGGHWPHSRAHELALQ